MRGPLAVVVAFVLVVPVAGGAAAPSVIPLPPGDQTSPAMWGAELAYVQQTGAARDVFLANLADPKNPVITPISSSGDVVGGPAINGSYLSYRRSGAVELFSLIAGRGYATITAPGAGRSSLSTTIIAWDQDAAGGSDVAWVPLGAGAPVILARQGAQHAVAAAYGWIAFIDESDSGSVHLLDTRFVNIADPLSLASSEARVYQGSSSGVGKVLDVAIWAADPVSIPRLAVTVDAGVAGADIVIVDPAMAAPVSLGVVGGKLNAHLLDGWVAYEDLSTGISQVRLWEWSTGRLFYAAMTGAPQTLNFLVAADAVLEALWTAEGVADLDIFEFSLALPLPPPPGPGSDGVTCADAGAVVLADFTVTAGGRPDVDLEVTRDVRAGGDDHGDDGWHVRETGSHDERWHSERAWRSFGFASFDAPSPRRVLFCIDAVDVASAWIGVGSEVVAAPADFRMGVLSLQAGLTVAAGDGRVGAVVIARPGGSLRVRVLDDPAGDLNGPPLGSTCAQHGNCPPPPGGILSKFGCGSSGGAGDLASLLLTGLVAGRPMRRRPRS